MNRGVRGRSGKRRENLVTGEEQEQETVIVK